MTVLPLINAAAYVAGYDFTGDSNEARLSMTAAELDRTTFRSGGWREKAGGVKSQALDLKGFWQSGAAGTAVDPEAFADLGGTSRVHTLAPAEAEGGVAYLFRAGRFRYELLGPHGALAPFSLASQGTDGYGVVRGQLAKSKGEVSATGALGSVLNLGAPTASQFVYCSVHVFSAGTSLTLQLQSDTSASFASPTTQATIGPLTAQGGTWMARVPGALAGETHWRLNVSAITGTFLVAAAIGVQ